jgi:DNA-directed RNA polymerase specialized sigma24 family protein
MDEREWLAERFDEYRPHLKAVAYRMLGSLAEADDAVQDAWLRLSRYGATGAENLGGWLTRIVARVCLNMLRSRKLRPEEHVGVHVPDPLISSDDGIDPEHQVMLADSVGLALQVVLDTPDACGTARVRLARLVRRVVRRDRANGGVLGRIGSPVGKPRATTGARPRAGA